MNQTNTSAEILNNQSNERIHIPDKGPIAIPMTNDYLFRALLQRNNNVLKGLISALLHLDPKDISSVLITNPIELGKTFEEKDFILDIKLIMNNYVIINLEMQVINEHNWPDRSLNYLCRCFDSLEKGDSYTSAHPVIQIGLLNFTLFPEYPEFYATYKFLNVKNYTLYSDKLCLSVLDLTHIDLATKEDKQYQLDYWAALFKSTTWEDLKMLAQNNEYIRQASET
ncbi:MAG: Rpn family recombination-promoting nuclease/putative transposase, partial [Lachnospiraceae bacterium]|nr:Rpn family recombination-promoting nuclease/putative transposase [Lachnospiraceae bacterium]